MAGEYGRNVLGSTGRSVMCIADGDFSGVKTGGITLDLSTVGLVTGAPVTLLDDTVVPIGVRYLRFGQVLTKITLAGTDVVTINGVPTGGTFTITVTNAAGVATTTALAFNATAATVLAALVALANVGAGNATVTGSAGGPYTVGFVAALGPTTITSSGAALTGGTAPTATTVQTSDNAVGYFGPYDPAAGDGRQTLTRGSVFILNRTWLESPIGAPLGGPGLGTTHPPAVFDRGVVWKPRILATTGAHSLAAGPTFTELEAAMPGLRYNDQ